MKSKIHRHNVIPTLLLSLVMQPLSEAVAEPAPGDYRYQREDQSEVEAFPPSIFPHWVHRINYRCDACHDSLFEMKYGATPITMDLMKEGKVCGTCHDGSAAFASSFQTCNRCHTSVEE